MVVPGGVVRTAGRRHRLDGVDRARAATRSGSRRSSLSRLVWRGARDRDTRSRAGPTTTVEFSRLPAAEGGTLHRSARQASSATRTGSTTSSAGSGRLARCRSTSRPSRGSAASAGRGRSGRARSASGGRSASRTSSSPGGAGPSSPRSAKATRAGSRGRPKAASRCGSIGSSRRPISPGDGRSNRASPFEEAGEVLRTEWAILPARDGGTDVHLLETGFRGPKNHRLNSEGWDTDIEPSCVATSASRSPHRRSRARHIVAADDGPMTETILAPLDSEFVPPTVDRLGAPGARRFQFTVVGTGSTGLSLVNRRPWEPGARERRFDATIDVPADGPAAPPSGPTD